MGYENEKGGQMPGMSAFHKDESGRIFRTGTTLFVPAMISVLSGRCLTCLKDGPAGLAAEISVLIYCSSRVTRPFI